MKRQKSSGFRETLARSLQLPQDLVSQEAILTLTGDGDILLENYRRILEYHQDHLLVQTKNRKIRIDGEKLQVLYYTGDEMKVSGNISAIHYEP